MFTIQEVALALVFYEFICQVPICLSDILMHLHIMPKYYHIGYYPYFFLCFFRLSFFFEHFPSNDLFNVF